MSRSWRAGVGWPALVAIMCVGAAAEPASVAMLNVAAVANPAFIAILNVAALAVPTPGPIPPTIRQAAPPTAFGFAVGEERRYALGPPDALEPGEGDLWIVRLESFVGAPPERRARFRLLHEARRYPRQANVFAATQLIVKRVSMDITVNEHGFPLRIVYQSDVENAPSPHTREEVTVQFEEGAFRVHNRLSMGYRRFKIGVPSSPLADPTVPRGVYVSSSENPGLYSLILAGKHIEEKGDLEYLVLRPGELAARESWRWDRPTERGNLSNRRLRFEERTTVDIGGVEEVALRLRTTSGRSIYVRDDGTLLRIDTSTRRRRSAFIRLLRPSEY